MALYVVQARGADDASLARATIVKDGFSWSAFVFAQLWLLYHRLWLPLLIWVVLEVAYFVVVFPHVASAASALVDLLAHVFIGFEGNRLRLAKGGRRAALVDVIEGRDKEEAEVRFFRRHRPETRAAEIPVAETGA